MSNPAQQTEQIVDAECRQLLQAMRDAHPDAKDELGISVALYCPQDPDVPGFWHYGQAGPRQQAITAATVFAVGSVTKVFTAVLAAWLSQQGLIGALAEAKLAPYLPLGAAADSAYWRAVSFLEFATQTSGMPRPSPSFHPSTELFAGQPPPPDMVTWWTLPAHLMAFEAQRGNWVYSDPGFVTLGYAVVNAAQQAGRGATYADLLASQITQPLQMRETFVGTQAPPGALLSQGHDKNGRGVPITKADDLKSSARDMLAFLAAVDQAMRMQATGLAATPLQQALASSTRTWVEAPHGEQPKIPMGLGWQISEPQNWLHKDGLTGLGGSSCNVVLTRTASNATVGIALMTNQVTCSPDKTAMCIVEKLAALGS